MLFIWLVPALAFPAYTFPDDAPSTRFVTRPYLRVATAPPLRFSETLPPPDLTTRLPAGAPPLAPSTVPSPAAAAALPPTPTDPSAIAPAIAPAEARAQAEPATPPDKPSPAPPLPAAILPDETRPKVRPEDFLPYFQFPGSSTLDAPPAPAPGTLPPSSATYRLQ